MSKLFTDLTGKLDSNSASFSTYFYNIDGNKTNFDEFSVKLRSIKEELSVIGLAETNIDPCNKDLFKLKLLLPV